MLSVADWAEIGFLELAGRAAEAIRELIHRTRVPGVFTGPAELYRLVAELAVLAGGLPHCLANLIVGCTSTTTPAGSGPTTTPMPAGPSAALPLIWPAPARPRMIWPAS